MEGKNDWIIASIKNPSFDAADMKNVIGLNLNNTQLLAKEDYYNSPDVQEAFKDATTGEFNKTAFNNYYDQKANSFSNFSTESSIDNYEYSIWDTSRPANGKIRNTQFTIGQESNPDDIKVGIAGINETTLSPKSIRERAQGSKIFDTSTGKFTDKSVNDISLFGNPFQYIKSLWGDPLVYATYDKDTWWTDPFSGERILKHKGEYKLNDDGEYYTETLGGRSLRGKQVVSAADYLTSENSIVNKYDFFDSDDLEKSKTGVIAKNIAAALPMFIPYVGTFYSGLMVARELAKSLPMVAGIVNGLAANNEGNSTLLNTLAAYGQKFTSSTSDYAQENTFAFENFGNLMSDVALQWGQQKFVAQALSKITGGGKSVLAGAQANAFTKYKKEVDTLLNKAHVGKLDDSKLIGYLGTNSQAELAALEKTGKWTETALGKAALNEFMPAAEKAFSNRMKLGQDLSLAYMTLISNTDVYDSVLEKGGTARDAALITLGSMAGMYSIDRFGHLGEMFFQQEPERLAFRKAAKEAADQFMDTAGSELAKETGKKGVLNLIKKGVGLGSGIVKKFWTGAKDRTLGFVGKAIGEGLEEVGEEVATDMAKYLGGLASEIGITTQSDYGAFENPFERYMMSFLGGTAGGALFGVKEMFTKDTTPEFQHELSYLIRQGKKDEVLKELSRLKSTGELGSKSLSYETTTDAEGNNTYLTADEGRKSQADYNYEGLTNLINQMDLILNDNRINLSDDEVFDKMVQGEYRANTLKDYLKDYADGMKDISYISKYQEDFQKLSEKIINADLAIKNLMNETTDPAQRSNPEFKEKMDKLKKQKEELIKEKDYLFGEGSLGYVEKTLFAMDTALSSNFVTIGYNQFVRHVTGKSVEDLTESEKITVDQKYEQYKKTVKDDLDTAFKFYKEMGKAINPEVKKFESGNFGKVLDDIQKFRTDNPYPKLLQLSDKLDSESQAEYESLAQKKDNETDAEFEQRKKDHVDKVIAHNTKQQVDWIQKLTGKPITTTDRRFLQLKVDALKHEIVRKYVSQLKFNDTDGFYDAILNKKIQDAIFDANLKDTQDLRDTLKQILKAYYKSKVKNDNAYLLDEDTFNDQYVESYLLPLNDAIDQNQLDPTVLGLPDTYRYNDQQNEKITKLDFIAAVKYLLYQKNPELARVKIDTPELRLALQHKIENELENISNLSDSEKQLYGIDPSYKYQGGAIKYNDLNVFIQTKAAAIALSNSNFQQGQNLDAFIQQYHIAEQVIADNELDVYNNVLDSYQTQQGLDEEVKGFELFPNGSVNSDLENLGDLLRLIKRNNGNNKIDSFIESYNNLENATNLDEAFAINKDAYYNRMDLVEDNEVNEIISIGMSSIKQNIDEDGDHKVLSEIEKTSITNNPIIPLLKAIHPGANDEDLETMLQTIYSTYQSGETSGDFQLTDAQLTALEQIRKDLTIAAGYIHAASVSTDLNTPVGHNKTMNQYVEKHKDVFKKYEKLPEVTEDDANALIAELDAYTNEINAWINKHTKNTADKDRRFIKADQALTKSMVETYTNFRAACKIAPDCDLMEGFEQLSIDNNLSSIVAIQQLLFVNYRKALANGYTLKKILDKVLPNIINVSEAFNQETAKLDDTITSGRLTNYNKFQLFVSCLTHDPVEFYQQLKNKIDSNDKFAPISIQEYATHLQFAQQKDPELINKALQWLADYNNGSLSVLTNTTITEGLGGSGKTFTVDVCIPNGGTNAWLSGPTKQQISGLFKVLPNGTEKSKTDLFNTIFGGNPPSNYDNIVEKVGNLSKHLKVKDTFKPAQIQNPPEYLVIDECTHFSTSELLIISKFCEINGIKLKLLGDTHQNGAKENIEDNLILAWRTPPLYLTLRDSNVHKANNLQSIVSVIDEIAEKEQHSEQEKQSIFDNFKNITLNYYIGDSDFHGELIADDVPQELIPILKQQGKSIAFIGLDTSSAYNTLKNAGITPTLVDPTQVQGQEFDYVVVDQDWSESLSKDDFVKTLFYLRNLYTMTSRSRSGTIIINHGLTSYIKNKKALHTGTASTLERSTKKFREYRIPQIEDALSKNQLATVPSGQQGTQQGGGNSQNPSGGSPQGGSTPPQGSQSGTNPPQGTPPQGGQQNPPAPQPSPQNPLTGGTTQNPQQGGQNPTGNPTQGGATNPAGQPQGGTAPQGGTTTGATPPTPPGTNHPAAPNAGRRKSSIPAIPAPQPAPSQGGQTPPAPQGVQQPQGGQNPSTPQSPTTPQGNPIPQDGQNPQPIPQPTPQGGTPQSPNQGEQSPASQQGQNPQQGGNSTPVNPPPRSAVTNWIRKIVSDFKAQFPSSVLNPSMIWDALENYGIFRDSPVYKNVVEDYFKDNITYAWGTNAEYDTLQNIITNIVDNILNLEQADGFNIDEIIPKIMAQLPGDLIISNQAEFEERLDNFLEDNYDDIEENPNDPDTYNQQQQEENSTEIKPPMFDPDEQTQVQDDGSEIYPEPEDPVIIDNSDLDTSVQETGEQDSQVESSLPEGVSVFSNISYAGIEINEDQPWTKGNSNEDLAIFIDKDITDDATKEQVVTSLLQFKCLFTHGYTGKWRNLPDSITTRFDKDAFDNAEFIVKIDDVSPTNQLVGLSKNPNSTGNKAIGLSSNKRSIVVSSNGQQSKIFRLCAKIKGRDGNTYYLSLGGLNSPHTWERNTDRIIKAMQDAGNYNGASSVKARAAAYRAFIENHRNDASGTEIKLKNPPKFTKYTRLESLDKPYKLKNFKGESEYDNVVPTQVTSPVYTILDADELGVSEKLKGKAVMFASDNLLYTPEQLKQIYIQQKKAREQSGTPMDVRMIVLNNAGVSLNALQNSSLMDKFVMRVNHKKGEMVYQFPFESQPMGLRMYRALWNYRADLKRFLNYYSDNERSLTNLNIDGEPIAKFNDRKFNEYREQKKNQTGDGSLSEQEFREAVVQGDIQMSSDEKTKLQEYWKFNDNLSSICRLFRLGYNSSHGAYLRTLTNINDSTYFTDEEKASGVIGIYINPEIARFQATILDRLFDKVIHVQGKIGDEDFQLLPRPRTNDGKLLDETSYISYNDVRNQNGNLINWFTNVLKQKNISLELSDSKTDQVSISGINASGLSALPNIIIQTAKHLQYAANNYDDVGLELQPDFNDEGEPQINYYRRVAYNDSEKGSLEYDWYSILNGELKATDKNSLGAALDMVGVIHNNENDRGEYQDVRIQDLFNLAFHGSVDITSYTDFTTKPMCATKVPFKYGFFTDTIAQAKLGEDQAAADTVNSQMCFTCDKYASGPRIMIDFTEDTTSNQETTQQPSTQPTTSQDIQQGTTQTTQQAQQNNSLDNVTTILGLTGREISGLKGKTPDEIVKILNTKANRKIQNKFASVVFTNQNIISELQNTVHSVIFENGQYSTTSLYDYILSQVDQDRFAELLEPGMEVDVKNNNWIIIQNQVNGEKLSIYINSNSNQIIRIEQGRTIPNQPIPTTTESNSGNNTIEEKQPVISTPDEPAGFRQYLIDQITNGFFVIQDEENRDYITKTINDLFEQDNDKGIQTLTSERRIDWLTEILNAMKDDELYYSSNEKQTEIEKEINNLIDDLREKCKI